MGRIFILFMILANILVAHAATAETRYVTDQLSVTLRAGESTRYKILRMLPSGTPLEVIEINQNTEYAHVRTEDGTLGYVLTHQLQAEPVARARIEEIETKLEALRQNPTKLAAQLDTLRSEHAALVEKATQLERKKQELEQELATIRHASSNVVELADDRDRLRIQVSELIRERATLIQENRDLANQSHQRWFMIGAGVLTGGILIGVVLPHLRSRRRRSTWDSF